jgi:predicted AAA+ superfamily ATPase
MTTLDQFLTRAELLMQRLEHLLPATPLEIDWNAPAFRWRMNAGRGSLQAISKPSLIRFDDLQHIDEQKQLIHQNTLQFVQGNPANHVLLTGARGTGKSSLVKACLAEFVEQGLRLIEVNKTDLLELPSILDLISTRPERFILFCDDLSFEEGEGSYKALKVALDGSLAIAMDNCLIYATSNRRHLMPERMAENQSYQHGDVGELHPGETVEEKISLSERFGLWVSFYSFSQDHYLNIVGHWLREFSCNEEQIAQARGDALRWALQRGSRSGRVASQFARDYVGRLRSTHSLI